MSQRSLPRLPQAAPLATECEVQGWVRVRVTDVASREQSVPAEGDTSGLYREVFRWKVITVAEALATEQRGRCIECKEPVRPHRASVNGMAAHFEHLDGNPSCSRSDARRGLKPLR